MNLGLGSRLLLTALAVVVLLELVVAIVLRSSLRHTVEAQVIAELERHAASTRATVIDLPGLDGPPGQRVVARIAAATRTDILIVRADGEVLVNSAATAPPW